MRTGLHGIVFASLVAAACTTGSGSPSPQVVGGDNPTVLPVMVTQQLVAGPNRIVFGLLDAKTNRSAAAPDRTVSFAFYEGEAAEGTPVAKSDGTFVWGIEDVNGLYITNVTLPTVGDYVVAVTTSAPGAPTETIRFAFEVHEDSTTVRVGEKAPASDTLTAADVGGDLSRLSTDTDPDPAFYELSVADAVAQGRPFVLVFATPGFCTSQQCGPTLDHVKPFAKEFPDVAFINVEPFELQVADGRLQPVLDSNGQLKPVQAVRDWGLLSEPWTFIVDRGGVVRYSIEAAASPEELRAAIGSVAAP